MKPTLTMEDTQRIEESVDDLIDAIEIQDEELSKVVRAQFIQDCHDEIGKGNHTVDSMIAKNLAGANGTRLRRMRGEDCERALRAMAKRRKLI